MKKENERRNGFFFRFVNPRTSVPYPSRAGRCRATRGTRGFGRNARARGTRDEVRALAYLTGAAPGVGTADATARRAERLEAPIDFICTACPARALRAARLGRAVLVAAVAERPESIMATIVCVARGECASGRREVRGLEWQPRESDSENLLLLCQLCESDTIFPRILSSGCLHTLPTCQNVSGRVMENYPEKNTRAFFANFFFAAREFFSFSTFSTAAHILWRCGLR